MFCYLGSDYMHMHYMNYNFSFVNFLVYIYIVVLCNFKCIMDNYWVKITIYSVGVIRVVPRLKSTEKLLSVKYLNEAVANVSEKKNGGGDKLNSVRDIQTTCNYRNDLKERPGDKACRVRRRRGGRHELVIDRRPCSVSVAASARADDAKDATAVEPHRSRTYHCQPKRPKYAATTRVFCH